MAIAVAMAVDMTTVSRGTSSDSNTPSAALGGGASGGGEEPKAATGTGVARTGTVQWYGQSHMISM